MPKFLERRRRRWYAKLEIPRDLRMHFGKVRLVKSLETESLTEAERLVLPVIARWKAEFEAIRTGNTKALELLAQSWEQELRQVPDGDEKETLRGVLEDKVEDIRWSDPQAADSFYKVVTGQTKPTLTHLEEWLASLDNDPKSIDMKRSDVHRLSETFGHTHEVTKRAVQRWTHYLQHVEQLNPNTVRRIVSACRRYWKFLDRSGHINVEALPFEDVVERKGAKTRGAQAIVRQPFAATDVVHLWQAAEHDGTLQDLIWLAMWTGCRIEELCSLNIRDVGPDRFAIAKAKSKAGVRVLPIHPKLAPTLERLCSDSTDQYVLSGLTFNKYGDRSNAIGKRFGRLKTSVGYGPEFVFHSIRKTVATLLENAGVPENVSADILGHEKKTMTYGLYSGGSSFEVLQNAVAEIDYPCITML